MERKSLYQMGGNINAGIGQNIGEQGMQYADLDGLIEHLWYKLLFKPKLIDPKYIINDICVLY